MPFKPNYRHDRAERDRNKQAKKLEKLRAKEEPAAFRRGAESGADPTSESGEAADGDASQPMKGEADALGSREEED